MGVQSFGNPGASFRNRFGRTGKRASNPPPLPFSATGGTITTYGSYTVHTFSYPNSQDFVVSSGTKEVEYLVVGGGGGGGNATGADEGSGGGGAGGLRIRSPLAPAPINNPNPFPVSPGTYTVTVGQAGSTRPGRQSGNPGGSSQFGPPTGTEGTSKITAAGGGGGGGIDPDVNVDSYGFAGGSGGGGMGYHSYTTPRSGNTPPVSPSQGNPGGFGATVGPNLVGGGGGGISGSGTPGGPNTTTGGAGGSGLTLAFASASPVVYSQGGNGGGDGGGTAGGSATGVGGGGGGAKAQTSDGSPGSNGIVIIRYLA